MLIEGNSIRSVERLTGVNRNTIMALVVTIGKRSLEDCVEFSAKLAKRVHSTLKETPAMAAALTDHVWSFGEMLQETAKTSTHS